jgi:hypothetical protein
MKNLCRAISSSIHDKCLNIIQDLKTYLTIDKEKLENFMKWKNFISNFKDEVYDNFKVKIKQALLQGGFRKEVDEDFNEDFSKIKD